MTLQERLDVSYAHVSDEFPEDFIKSLHRAQGSTRMLVRHPNPDGTPYGISNYRWRIRGSQLSWKQIDQEVKSLDNPYETTLWNYYNRHWFSNNDFQCP